MPHSLTSPPSLSTSLGKTQGTYKFVRSTADYDLAGSVALNYTPKADQLRVSVELNVSL